MNSAVKLIISTIATTTWLCVALESMHYQFKLLGLVSVVIMVFSASAMAVYYKDLKGSKPEKSWNEDKDSHRYNK